MPFNYQNIQENRFNDHFLQSLPKRSNEKDVDNEKEVDNTSLVDEHHEFHNDMTRICTCCGYCTSFGSRCCRCVMDRSNDLGKICGCGKGDGGCKKCGLCRTCAEAIESPQCPGPDHLYRLSNDGDRLNDEENVLQVGSRIVSQWQREGGTQYPGKVIGVNNDGTYDIQYDDGDRDENVPRRRISSITKIKQQQEPRARRIEERSIRRQQINVSSPTRSEFRRFGMSSTNAVNNDSASKELKSIERHLFQLARSLTGGLDLDWERDQLQESDNPLERLRNFGRNLTSSGRHTTTSTTTSNHHPGLMQCKCNHALGRLSYPLDPALFHLSGRCKWLCCGADWNNPNPCPNGQSTSKQSKDSSLTSNYKVLSYPEIYNEFVDIPITTADSNFGGCNFITKLPPGYITMTI